MSDSEDSDDLFNFQSKVNFDEQQEEKETMISNDYHFKILSEICENFYSNIQKHDDFNHKISWRIYSNLEPIKIEIKSSETLPGLCDIIKPDKIFYNKVLIALTTDIFQIENLLPNMGTTCYESLYPLSVYGEEIEGQVKSQIQKDTKEETQISFMLPYLNEIYEKILSLLTIAINLMNQLLSLYTSEPHNKEYYSKQFRNYTFDLPFEYLGKILSYFLAIDSVVSGNDFIKKDWDKYRTMFHKCKNNASEFNMNDEQKKKLDKFIKRVNAPIFENTCYNQSMKMILEKAGETTPSGAGIIKAAQNKTFLFHLTDYLKRTLGKIYSDLGTFSEVYESIQFFQYLALYGLYLNLTGSKCDKNILKSVWTFQKKITTIPLVGISSFSIRNFLIKFSVYNGVSFDPSDPVKNEINSLMLFEKNLPILMNNLRLNVMTWISRFDSDVFDYRIIMGEGRQKQLALMVEKTNQRYKFIMNGLSLANYLRRTVFNILNVHLNNGLNITPELIGYLTTGLELIKVVEAEFYKILPKIAQNLNVMNRILVEPIQEPLKKIQESINKKFKEKSPHGALFKDQLSAANIIFICSHAIPSPARIAIIKMCLNTLTARETIDSKSVEIINNSLYKLEIINNLSREIKRSCDCSFLYLYQDIIPTSLKLIYKTEPVSLYYFAMALNDIDKPLMYIKYKENNGFDMVKTLRKNIIKLFEDNFLKILSKDIEDDLRKQIHRVFIEGLNPPAFSEVNLSDYLKIKKFKLFDCVMDIKRYVEEHMNMTFYKMTTLNLNDWQTYQQMRVLAKHKYGLNLHEVFLPSQNLSQGKDILDIIRNLRKFTLKYTHNLHNQIFIEIGQESNYVNIVGVKQILNSLYTHGTGIVNSVLNKAFGYISKTTSSLLEILFDDYILSYLKEEKTFWDENKSKINYNYPMERALNLRSKILTLDENKKVNQISKVIRYITQIGNTVAFARCIRTALMDYNSQNVNLLTNNEINEYNKISQQISLQVDIDPTNPDNNSSNISSNLLNNLQNSLNESNKMFCETINNLKQIGKNNINYLEILVTSFGDTLSSSKIPEIEMFSYLIPPITITFIDNAINAKDNLLKKNKTEEGAYFSNDGFMVGICYLLKIFDCDKKFESLNWFPSVINYYTEKQIQKQKKDKNSFGVDILNERQINSYKDQFEMQFYTYTSATILFTE